MVGVRAYVGLGLIALALFGFVWTKEEKPAPAVAPAPAAVSALPESVGSPVAARVGAGTVAREAVEPQAAVAPVGSPATWTNVSHEGSQVALLAEDTLPKGYSQQWAPTVEPRATVSDDGAERVQSGPNPYEGFNCWSFP